MSATTSSSRTGFVRSVGFAVIAVAAIAVTILGAPESPDPISTDTFERQITVALEDYESNDANTSGAPQQQVVNGWVARDLLTILTQQTNAVLAASQTSASDPRIPLLLLLLVFAVALHAATLPALLRPRAGTKRDWSVNSPLDHAQDEATRAPTTENDQRTLE